MGGRRQKRREYALFEGVRIGAAVAEGNCIARIDEQVVFVKFAAPGDLADIQVVKRKKNYMEARIVNLIEPSPLRVAPRCEHFGVCGGCKWQHLDYTEQLKAKSQQVKDSLERLGGQRDFELLPIIGGDQTYEYRNKLDLTFSDQAWVLDFDKENPIRPKGLGFHIPGRFDKVLDVQECHLMPPYVNQIHRGLKAFCEQEDISFFNLVKQEGLMRNLLMRCNAKGEWMVLVSFFYESEEVQAVLNYLQSSFAEIKSLLFVINDKKNDTLHGLEVQVHSGEKVLTERLGDREFVIQAQSFFQTNTAQAKRLYDLTKSFAQLTGEEKVYDLYTGTGSIALYVADQAKEVIGIEYVEEAIADAKINMANNGMDHLKFYAGDMKDLLTADFIAEHGQPDVVITDPPRDGMHPSVVQRLVEMKAKRLVYVSCNPATQARDAKLLEEAYKLVKVQPVDMFPHTHHVESVALFERK
jgi:23S rRNA (uracil1939-C5)-methyltransferase